MVRRLTWALLCFCWKPITPWEGAEGLSALDNYLACIFTLHRLQVFSLQPLVSQKACTETSIIPVSVRFGVKGKKIRQNSLQELQITLLWRHHWKAVFTTESTSCLLTQSMLSARDIHWSHQQVPEQLIYFITAREKCKAKFLQGCLVPKSKHTFLMGFERVQIPTDFKWVSL